MDSISQAALGASIGEAFLGKKTGWRGAAAGAVIATLPDLDVILLPFYNAVQRISIHRGYSHSILFGVVGAIIIAWLLRSTRWAGNVSAGRLWLFAFLTLVTHFLLDCFTSYGTQLFLPFSDLRVSFDSVTIFDPVYTLPLLAGLFFALYIWKDREHLRARANFIGLVISTGYLLLTLMHKQSIERIFYTALEKENLQYDALLTVPVTAGNVKWYGVGRTADSLYIGDFSRLNTEPVTLEAFPVNDHLLDPVDPYITDRLKWFAKDFYTVAESDGRIRLYNMQCDMQGIRTYGDYRAPTAFYFELTPDPEKPYGWSLESGMHRRTP